jgi:multidrug efflux pump
MTSFAFVFGVLPMALASGAGSGAQNAIGTAVIGGMLAATILVPLLTPFFFVEVHKLFERDWFKRREPATEPPALSGPAE